MVKHSEVGYKHPLTGHSQASNNRIFCIPAVFKGIPPVTGNFSREKVCSPTALDAKSASGNSSPGIRKSEQRIEQRLPEGKSLQSGQANEHRVNAILTDEKIIGQYTVVYDRLSDGRQVVRREKYVPIEPDPENLGAIWINDNPSRITYPMFVFECIRNGIVKQYPENNRLVWPHQAVTIRACIFLLVKHGLIKDMKSRDKFYKAFTGTFQTPRVSQDRSLGGFQEGRKFRGKKEREFTDTLNEIFSFQ